MGAWPTSWHRTPCGYANHTGSTSTPFQWLGGYGVYYDSDTDFHLTLHRAYSCSLKRFIQPDPLGIDGGVNVYMWANMNPLVFIDPYGLKTIVSPGIANNNLVNSMASDLNADIFIWHDGLPGLGIPTTVGEHFHTGQAAKDFEAFIINVAAENPGEPIDLVLYSGSGQIGVNAAELLADDNIEIRNMILLGAPIDEWNIDNVEQIYNFTSVIDPLSWNINFNPDDPVEYMYFNDVLHFDFFGNDWPRDPDVRDAIKKLLK